MADTGNDGKMIANPDTETKNLDETNGGWVLQNSDQPGMTLVASQLIGPNYLSWSLAVKTALEAKDKLGFVDGSIKEPEDPVEHKRWKPVDSMVKSWLTNSLTKDLSETFMFCNSVKELCANIAERYSVSNDKTCPKMHMWNKRLDEQDSDIKLVQFLIGLHLMYDALRGQILNLDPLPSVNKAFSKVVRQEIQKEVNLAFNNVESSVMMVNTCGRKTEDKKADKAGKYCDHCNQNGHTQESCFKIIGFPERYKDLKEQKKKAGKKVGNAANMVADTPIDFVKDKQNIDFSGVLTTLQEIAKVVKNKAEEQANFANLSEFADGSTKHVKMMGSVVINSDIKLIDDQRTRKTLIEGKVAGNLYVLRQTNIVERIGNCISSTRSSTCNHANHNIASDVILWHHKLGHAAIDTIKHVDGSGINIVDTSSLDPICELSETRQGKKMGEGDSAELETVRKEKAVSDAIYDLSGSENRHEEDLSVDGEDQQQDGEDLSEEGTRELELQNRPSILIQEQSPNNNIEQVETQEQNLSIEVEDHIASSRDPKRVI
ncbi:uncharacterized protein G2W53_016368 [Senna tora]|uniref:Retrotransposon Copia-like N-terminal domain-containing protein n=1 Tax=Senna tora TaxID=362788 RepID=A0A834TPA8_9FABA|nr:uncharacterized protein G2W53_016368 [Senna tora]